MSKLFALGFLSLSAGLVGCSGENESEAARARRQNANSTSTQLFHFACEKTQSDLYNVYLRGGDGSAASQTSSSTRTTNATAASRTRSTSGVFLIKNVPEYAFVSGCDAFARAAASSIEKNLKGKRLEALYAIVEPIRVDDKVRGVLCIVPDALGSSSCLSSQQSPSDAMLDVLGEDRNARFVQYFPKGVEQQKGIEDIEQSTVLKIWQRPTASNKTRSNTNPSTRPEPNTSGSNGRSGGVF
jgi:hypothetical protein